MSQPERISEARPLWEEFDSIVKTRRSVRKFTEQPVSERDMNDVIDAGIVAPNSSNLQPFEFVWVRSPEKKAALVKACFSQSAARTAQELVVCVARWDQWDETRQEMADWLKTQQGIPKNVTLYYDRLSKVYYSQGPLGLGGLIKQAGYTLTGLQRPTPRGPVNREDMRVWAVKSCALACENMMLAARAKGFDSCPMEGNDPVRVGKILGLPRLGYLRTWDIPMVLGFGYRSDKGIWGKQWRRERSKLVKEI